ncbi:hypothetical protein BJ684DRAFT_4784, partial [Piptocephalis cylindrospora]
LSLLGWLLAVIGQGINDVSSAYTWWCTVYLLLLSLAMVLVVGQGSLRQYRLVLLAFSVIGIIYATQNIGVWYIDGSAMKVAGVGYFFMTIACYLWVIALGSDSDSAVSRNMAILGYQAPESGAPGVAQQSMTSVTTTAPHARPAQANPGAPVTAANPGAIVPTTSTPVSNGSPPSGPQDVQYLYRAQALYAYTASPEDPNELSFGKNDVLEIVDTKGKWWQAKRKDGTIGIVPSNYV